MKVDTKMSSNYLVVGGLNTRSQYRREYDLVARNLLLNLSILLTNIIID